jgi:hypothetical protein
MDTESHGGPLVELVVLPNKVDADFLVAHLWSQGVRALIKGSEAEGGGHLGLVNGARVMVIEADLDRACEVLEDLSELDITETEMDGIIEVDGEPDLGDFDEEA